MKVGRVAECRLCADGVSTIQSLYDVSTICLISKEMRKMAAWLTKAADWAEQQEKEANQW